jgi:hypothetical protein
MKDENRGLLYTFIIFIPPIMMMIIGCINLSLIGGITLIILFYFSMIICCLNIMAYKDEKREKNNN